MDTSALRKARGAFFTPPPIAHFITKWAVRGASDLVLEPSCGDAAFLVEAVGHLARLTHEPGVPPIVHGVDIHDASVASARARVRAVGGEPIIRTADFFSMEPTPHYDAVVGNPPFVRFQAFTGESRRRSQEAALKAGVPLSKLASSWAAFTVHAALFLKQGGRLGLVVPAELLSVNYASSVRRFLMESFSQVSLVLFTERVFPEVQEEVVLLLADGYKQGHSKHANIYQAQNAAELESILAASTRWTPPDPAEKWTPLLMSTSALAVYAELLGSENFVPLDEWGATTLGMVTGNNKYFALSKQRCDDLALQPSDMIRISPPGSRHLRGLSLSQYALAELTKRDLATYLFRPKYAPSKAAGEYIKAGEIAGVDQAYKCRVRKPWWRVPLVKPADLLLTYMNADTPRITTNSAGVHHLNSVHGVYLREDLRALAAELLPLASLTSMTLVGAETVGRSYGGGMLKLEPREADCLPVPSPELLIASRDELLAAKPQVGGLLRRGQLVQAASIVDEILLVQNLKVKRSSVKTLSSEFARLSSRRAARAANG